MFSLLLSSYKELETVQNSIFIIILGVGRRYSTRSLYKTTKKLNIEKLYVCEILMNQMKKKTFFNHCYDTRNVQNKYQKVPKFSKSHSQDNLPYYGSRLYFQLSIELKINLNSKKKNEKLYVLEHFQDFSSIIGI